MLYFLSRRAYGLCAAGMTVALTGCTFQTTPVTRRTITVTKPGVTIGHYPPVGLSSNKAQVAAFVAYFAAKGFPQTDMRAEYYPSGRVKTFHYHAAHLGSIVTVDIDGPGGKNAISLVEGGGSTTTQTSVTY